VLGLRIEETEGPASGFNDVRARHPDILALRGGLTGLPNAVRGVFPLADVQLCAVHQIRTATIGSFGIMQALTNEP
jgi:transposase-like protein